jgi:recombination protein RecR
MMHGDPIKRLIAELGRLPGVGERSAARLAYYIIKRSCPDLGGDVRLAHDLADALLRVTEIVGICEECRDIATSSLCTICADVNRDRNILCVVESPADVRAIHGCGAYPGLYHVLHGALSPLDGVGPEQLGLARLVLRIQRLDVEEVIMATDADMEGDITAQYLAELLRTTPCRVTRIASGIPTGGELEYTDAVTLGRALRERRVMGYTVHG